ncbi:MAG TPA: hypothetical protein VM871_08955, partial [Flavisolibacter sp.]|nr:hypothetical protein [Flavisolibacter sp.]
MRKHPIAVACIVFVYCITAQTFNAAAQNDQSKSFPSDSALLALASKYVHTPIAKTVTAQGEVFLQRNLTPYLQATVQKAPPVSRSEADHGHDHKDAMLRSFLSRPHPAVVTMNKYFADAAKEFGVPLNLLKAVAQVQSNWTQVSESIYGSWGVMGLIENKWVKQISLASSVLGVHADAIKNDAKTNIRAAAALLA